MPLNAVDIIVLGGGPIGLITTQLLTNQGFKVACLDQNGPDFYLKKTNHTRALALSWGSLRLFDTLNLKNSLIKKGAPINTIWVTQTGGTTALRYDSEAQSHPMGVNIDMQFLKKLLYKGAKAHLHLESTLAHLSFDGTMWHATTHKGNILKARFIIGADGRNSWLRNQLDLKVKRWHYPQKSLVATIHHSKPHLQQAYEHFLPEGPLALLPLLGKKSSLIWTVSPETATALMHVSVSKFSHYLTRQFGGTLGTLTLDPLMAEHTPVHESDLVMAYALGGHYCPQPYTDNAILIGDAAHTMHPVAGQGFNVGLRDAVQLVEHLTKNRSLGLAWWSLPALRAYSTSRRADVLSMLGLTHGLVTVFSRDIPLLSTFLSTGLGVVNRIPSLKGFLSKRAMGL